MHGMLAITEADTAFGMVCGWTGKMHLVVVRTVRGGGAHAPLNVRTTTKEAEEVADHACCCGTVYIFADQS